MLTLLKSQMAFRLSKKFLIGQVISRGYEKIPSVEVRVPQMVLDKYLLMVGDSVVI
jgi:hypothetical protein